MIRFSCPACGQTYKVKDEMAGKSAKCKKCEETMQVPQQSAPTSSGGLDDVGGAALAETPDDVNEVTEGGSVVYRHTSRARSPEVVEGDSANLERISSHIEQHLGEIDMVFHEILSDMVHVDVHWIKPTDEMPFHTLVTTGMSDLPMSTPPGAEAFAHAELMVRLPPEWPISEEAFKDENNYWPIRWLKQLARFPHEYQTWLFMGHTIPHGDPPEPFADNTNFCCWMLYPPIMVDEEFTTLEIDDEKTIFFFAIYPLYLQEMNLKLKKGAEALEGGFSKHQVTEVIDVERKNTAAKPWYWPF